MSNHAKPADIVPSPPSDSHALVSDEYARYLTLHGWPKHHWLWEHRAEVRRFYQQNGQDAAVRQYRIRVPTLKRIIGEHVDYDPAHGVSGDKAKWNRDHAEDILFYYDQHGTRATRREFALQRPTLERMLDRREWAATGHVREYAAQSAVHMAERSRVIAEQAQADNATLRREIRELREVFGLFREEVTRQLAAIVLGPIMDRLNVPEGKAQANSLSIREEGSNGPTGESSQDGADGPKDLPGQRQPGSAAGGGNTRAQSGRAGLLSRGLGAGQGERRALSARLPVR